MSLSGHLRELDARHRRLEAEIAEERKRPSADTLRLTELKREKLKVKEQLTAAKQPATSPSKAA